jgi:type IV pilus assembly protein PilW
MNRPQHICGAAGNSRRAARGFTLVEILVALGLGVLILLALTILFSRNTGNHAELERTTRQLESARFSLDMLGEDLMHAGYFGEFNPNTLPPPLTLLAPAPTPDPCATALDAQGWYTRPPAPLPAAPLPPPGPNEIYVPAPVQGIAAGTAIGCLTNRVPGTEAIVVRHAETGAATPLATASANHLYIQVARCATEVPVTPVRAAAGQSADFTLTRPDCATVNNALRRLTQRTYYIASCNDCVANDGIPTLKRVEMVDGQLRTLSVAEGVENLQVEYGVDTAAPNGQPDVFVTTGSGVINGVMPNVWENVVSVRVHLLTRSSQPTPGFSDTRTYQLGPDVAVVTPADGNKRTLMTTTVRLNNVGGRRE